MDEEDKILSGLAARVKQAPVKKVDVTARVMDSVRRIAKEQEDDACAPVPVDASRPGKKKD